jgi:hypothetical protein
MARGEVSPFGYFAIDIRSGCRAFLRIRAGARQRSGNWFQIRCRFEKLHLWPKKHWCDTAKSELLPEMVNWSVAGGLRVASFNKRSDGSLILV